MNRTLQLALATATAGLVATWTLALAGLWWLLRQAASILQSRPADETLGAVEAWAERPWVQHLLGPGDAAALRDALAWLLGQGGGPAAWIGWALTAAALLLVLAWAFGLLLAAGVAWALLALWRRLPGWWQARPNGVRPAASVATHPAPGPAGGSG